MSYIHHKQPLHTPGKETIIMDCSCLYSNDFDSDVADYYEESFPVAKNEWVCCECEQPIKKGEKYHNYRFVDGTWQSLRTCMTCFHIRNEVFCHRGYTIGVLMEHFMELYEMNYATGEWNCWKCRTYNIALDGECKCDKETP